MLFGCCVSVELYMKQVQSGSLPRALFGPSDPPGDPSRDLHAMREKDPLREDRNEVQELPCGHSPGVQAGSHHQLLNRKCNSAGASGERREADGLSPASACSSLCFLMDGDVGGRFRTHWSILLQLFLPESLSCWWSVWLRSRGGACRR